jgi:hypothetical protein
MEKTAPFETVTKLEVGERQLRVAIRLFFERKDMIAVHALATAAQEVLRQLAKARRIKGTYEHLEQQVRPEMKDALFEVLREPQNFFKHAGKDANKKLKFYYESTKYHLIDAVELYAALTNRRTPEMAMFFGWFVRKHPHVFKPTDADSQFQRALIARIHSVNFDDFEVILHVIDSALRQEMPEVNTRST